MAKKERNFHGEADFLRHQLRELAAETGTVIKDTNFMKKEECKEEIEALNRVKYKKELEGETRANIENLKKELADRNNQITALEKEKVELENAKADCIKEIVAKDKTIEIHIRNAEEFREQNNKLETEIEALEIAKQSIEKAMKELQESNQTKDKTIAANINKLAEHEKEIKEKNIELERYQKINKKLGQDIDILLAEIKELKNRKWYQFWK